MTKAQPKAAPVAAKPKPKPPAKRAPAKRQEIALVQNQQVAPAPSEAAMMIAMLERAGRDPAVSIEKMEGLLALKERMDAKAAEKAYNHAFALMQPALPVIRKDGRIVIPADEKKGRHVDQVTAFSKWEDMNEIIKPILSAHGFVISFKPGMDDNSRVTMTAVLRHVDGYKEEATVTLPHDSSGSKNNVQAVGSSMSYGKRYAAVSLLNLTTGGEDDDGAAASERAAKPDPYKKPAKTEEPKPEERHAIIAAKLAELGKAQTVEAFGSGWNALITTAEWKAYKAEAPQEVKDHVAWAKRRVDDLKGAE